MHQTAAFPCENSTELHENPELMPQPKKEGDNEDGEGELHPEEDGFQDIMSFLGLGKDSPHAYEEISSHEEHDRVLSYLGISKADKSSMLVALGIGDRVCGRVSEESLSGTDATPVTCDSWNLTEMTKNSSKTEGSKAPTMLNVSASPFRPAKFTKAMLEDSSKLNPSAIPFVPRALSPLENASLKPHENGVDSELTRAQAAVRHYQGIYTTCKEELQACNKLCQKEKDIARKAQEALDLKTKELERLRTELHMEAARAKQAMDQLAATQAEMAYYRKHMVQIQGQIQITWSQFLSKLQQETVARQASEENVIQLQTALQLVRQEAEQSASKVTELEGSLKEAQLLLQQQQERAETKEKEATFYRTMYNTAAKQVESSHAAVRASIEIERQARQEAEARSEQQCQDLLTIRQQAAGKQAQQALEIDALKRAIDASKDQQSA